ncbi:MAG: hypothetical protein LBC49_03360 [Bacteroidales bacterium]|jgi:hypothetical protein|nr:hypothetical protein [Bacteroidales bacterium]
MEEQSKLLAPVKKIFLGVMVFTISGLVYSIVAPIEFFDKGGVGAIVSVYCSLTALTIGYILALAGTIDLQKEAGDPAKKAICLIKTGFIALIAANIFEMVGEVREMAPAIFITVGAVASTILNVVAAIIFLIGYCSLKKEKFFNKEIRCGFSILFSGALVMLTGSLFGSVKYLFGPVGLLGNCEDGSPALFCVLYAILWAALVFAGFIMALLGWNKVKRGAVKSY